MKTVEKVSFSKFFPNGQQFVVIRGMAKSPADFDLSVDIGDGQNKTSFYLDPWSGKTSADMLKTMRDAVQQALEFYEKAMMLPAITKKNEDATAKAFWDSLGLQEKEEKPAKKPAAKKKKAAAKK